jgi:uncharacterized protein YkwD
MVKTYLKPFLSLFFILPVLSKSQEAMDLAAYKKLNEAETRLSEFKDSDHDLELKLIQLGKINQNRKKYKVKEVKLDILASRVANKMCKNAAENKYMGHWDTDGAKPYQRYAFAGGVDHVAENAAGKYNSSPYPKTDEFTLNSMEEMHKAFMDERAPRDAHKQNCIGPNHNYVGLGFYQTDKQFRYYEEFIDRYYTFVKVPSQLKPNETGELVIKPQPGKFFFEVLAFRENLLKPRTAASLNSTGGYEDYSNEIAVNIPPMDMPNLRNGDTYTIPLQFKKPGLYYLHICETDTEKISPGRYSDAGKMNACGIVIKVE